MGCFQLISEEDAHFAEDHFLRAVEETVRTDADAETPVMHIMRVMRRTTLINLRESFFMISPGFASRVNRIPKEQRTVRSKTQNCRHMCDRNKQLSFV